LAAARTLGLLNEDVRALDVTPLGARLAGTFPGSAEERQTLHEAIASSRIIEELAPGLLEPEPPERTYLAERIATLAGCSAATAARRAAPLP
jgi:hypothetical protein